MKFIVKIDGVENTLTFQGFSYVRGYQYLTQGNASSHGFQTQLATGQRFRTNGHFYEILRAA